MTISSGGIPHALIHSVVWDRFKSKLSLPMRFILDLHFGQRLPRIHKTRPAESMMTTKPQIMIQSFCILPVQRRRLDTARSAVVYADWLELGCSIRDLLFSSFHALAKLTQTKSSMTAKVMTASLTLPCDTLSVGNSSNPATLIESRKNNPREHAKHLLTLTINCLTVKLPKSAKMKFILFPLFQRRPLGTA